MSFVDARGGGGWRGEDLINVLHTDHDSRRHQTVFHFY